jgi:hypothetical protein
MPLIRPLPQARASITFSVQTVHHDRYLEPYIRLLRTKKGLANSIRPFCGQARDPCHRAIPGVEQPISRIFVRLAPLPQVF